MCIGGPRMPEISVVIVTWNGREHLDACLAAVAAQRGVWAETIVVDNASTDGTAKYVSERFPWVRLVALQTNCGFAGGNNAGAREARGRHLAFLNNDTVADPGWLRALRDGVDEANRVALTTSLVVYMHDPVVVDSAGDGLTRAGGAFKRHHGGPASGAMESCEVFGACGAAFLIPRAVFEEVGGFDEDFFASHEDVDLSYRARLRGYRVRYVAEAVVHHRGSATLGRLSPCAAFYGQRNLEWAYVKNTPTPLLLRTLLDHLVYNAAAAVHFARLGMLGTFLRAKRAAIVGLPRAWRKRAAIQRGRTVPSHEIWRHLEPHWLGLKLREETFDMGLAGRSESPGE
jgi:N-acetylglucosaminyl-diphospho-decaprenol L-rhamnosyltransferase